MECSKLVLSLAEGRLVWSFPVVSGRESTQLPGWAGRREDQVNMAKRRTVCAPARRACSAKVPLPLRRPEALQLIDAKPLRRRQGMLLEALFNASIKG
ncbi:MAG: hypothetical protein WBO24_07960 [Nitrospirales bacterium]